MEYPKMLYNEAYQTHVTNTHDMDSAQRRASCTKIVKNPIEEAEWVEKGWSASPVGPFVVAPPPAPPVPEVVRIPMIPTPADITTPSPIVPPPQKTKKSD